MLHLEERLEPQQQAIAHEILHEILTRIKFILDVGVGYLSMNRNSSSLSGGESQRIRLATQIGARLVNVLYILDEPSIGLHQRDNRRLINALKELRDLGNSVIVVEHDRDMILSADHVVDIGPGAGVHGGKVIFSGSHKQLLASKKKTLTLQYLNREKDIPLPQRRSIEGCDHIVLSGATGNNLKDVTFDLPLRRFVCITGVSGSGKSTLVNDTLHNILNRHFYHSTKEPLPYKSITGIEHIDKVIEIDQSPIGRTPRSNPATYVGVFDEIRALFTQLPSARIRGYKPGRFSFNVSGGRCEHCKGAGVRTIEMNFLPDVYVNCEMCNGKRYNRETLEIRYKGKSIADVLDMTINEAVPFFESYPRIYRKLKTIQDVGLGYITLGQQSTTLSGGEAQRIKLATELARPETGNTLYILDEPTTGLHFEDIRVLLEVLQRLVDRGNSILVIEHNMDVIKVADWVIDMGPDGGRKGGQITFAGGSKYYGIGNKIIAQIDSCPSDFYLCWLTNTGGMQVQPFTHYSEVNVEYDNNERVDLSNYKWGFNKTVQASWKLKSKNLSDRDYKAYSQMYNSPYLILIDMVNHRMHFVNIDEEQYNQKINKPNQKKIFFEVTVKSCEIKTI